MAKYAFFNFPTYGQVNPTLAVVQELVARGETVLYFNTEKFRPAIEATGAKFCPYDNALFRPKSLRTTHAINDNRRLAMLPIRMIQESRQVVPPLLQSVQAERPDCLVYSDRFLWARIVSHALGIPGVALRPTYAPSAWFRNLMLEGTGLSLSRAAAPHRLSDELVQLRAAYNLPFTDIASLIRGNESLTIVFVPRAFQPGGDTFNERFLFVGPSFNPERDKGRCFPFESLGSQPRLYISLGTVYYNKPEFYHACFNAFGNTDWQVILSLGNQLDPAVLPAVPENFITASYLPQLKILPQTDIFISHGGMNSTMESLYFGIPLIVIPHINEQKITALRVEELGLGIALDEAAVTADILRKAVSRIARDPGFEKRIRAMQKNVREAGGYQRAAKAIQDYLRT